MKDLNEIRQQYPQYNDMSDRQLANALHSKYYSDLPKKKFFSDLGIEPQIKRFKAEDLIHDQQPKSLQDYIEIYKKNSKRESEEARKTLKGIGNAAWDVGAGLANAIPSAAEMVWNLPGQAIDSAQQIYSNPERAAKNIKAGSASGVGGLLNSPNNIVQYLKKNNLAPDWLTAWKPEDSGLLPQNFDYRAAEGLGARQPGDELLYSGSQFAPNALFGMGAPTAWAIGQNENPLTAQAIPTVLKTGAKAASKAASKVKGGIDDIGKGKYSQAKTVERGNKIVSDLEQYYKTGYDTITQDPRLPNVEWDIPNNIFRGFNKINPKTSIVINKALSSRNPTDVHHAASKVGQYIYKQENSPVPNHTGLYYAYKLQEALENGLDNSLRTVPELEFSYRNLDKQFEGDLGRVGHKIRSKLKKYRKNKLGVEDIMRAFKLPESGAEFRHKFGKELPGIKSAKNPEAWKNIPFTREGYNLFKKHFGDK